jgi:hypothetical protein
MRKATICLLVVVLGSWTGSFGQSATTKNKNNYTQIVAKVHLTGQTAPIPPTTVLVPKKDGLYRVSAYLASFYSLYQQNLAFRMTWIDDLGQQSSGDLCLWNENSNNTSGTVWTTTMRIKASARLSYSVTPSNYCKRHDTYDVFFTVERLE